MIRRPPSSTRTDTLFPYTTLFRSENAIIIRLFALAIFSVATQKDPAFQASSPKTSAPPFGAAFFLRWLSGSLLFASPVDAIGTEDAMGGLWSILTVLGPILIAVVVIWAIWRTRRETRPGDEIGRAQV